MASSSQLTRTCTFDRPVSGQQARRKVLVPVRASKQSEGTPSSRNLWQQKAAAAASAAVLLFSPAAFAEGTPRKPTLGEERASYAEQLENAVKDRGQQLQNLKDYPTTEEQKNPLDQPFQNKLGAGNSSKDVRPLFKLDDSQGAPSKQLDVNPQLQQAVPDIFTPKPQPEPAQQTSSSAGSAASAVKQTTANLPSPPANVPNPAEAAKKVASKVPSPAAVPNPAASAKKAAKTADAGTKSPDPKEAAATKNAQILIAGVLVLGLTLFYSIERKADPSLSSGSTPGNDGGSQNK